MTYAHGPCGRLVVVAAFTVASMAALADPQFVGTYTGDHIQVVVRPAGEARYSGTITLNDTAYPFTAGGLSKISGMMGEGPAGRLFTLEVNGEVAAIKVSGVTHVLRRGATAPVASPLPPSSRVLVPGPPPLTQEMADAYVQYNQFLLQLLLGDGQVVFTRQQQEALRTQLVSSYAGLAPGARGALAQLPQTWQKVNGLWRQMDAQQRASTSRWYQEQWQRQVQHAAARMTPPQRAQLNSWNAAATRMRQGNVTSAQQILEKRKADQQHFNRSFAQARARKKGQGNADLRRQMGQSMTNHFVQMNMANMTTNMFLSGSPLGP